MLYVVLLSAFLFISFSGILKVARYVSALFIVFMMMLHIAVRNDIITIATVEDSSMYPNFSVGDKVILVRYDTMNMLSKQFGFNDAYYHGEVFHNGVTLYRLVCHGPAVLSVGVKGKLTVNAQDSSIKYSDDNVLEINSFRDKRKVYPFLSYSNAVYNNEFNLRNDQFLMLKDNRNFIDSFLCSNLKYDMVLDIRYIRFIIFLYELLFVSKFSYEQYLQ